MFGLQPTDIYSPCHTYGCHNRSTHFLGHADSPNGTVFYVCDQCGGELKESIIEEHKALTVEVAETPEAPEAVSEVKLEDLIVPELKKIAEEKGIAVKSKITKPELIELIEDAK